MCICLQNSEVKSACVQACILMITLVCMLRQVTSPSWGTSHAHVRLLFCARFKWLSRSVTTLRLPTFPPQLPHAQPPMFARHRCWVRKHRAFQNQPQLGSSHSPCPVPCADEDTSFPCTLPTPPTHPGPPSSACTAQRDPQQILPTLN